MADEPTLPPTSTTPEAQQVQEEPRRRAFTLKALLFGTALAVFVVVGAWFNDQYLNQSPAIGNFLPPLPLGLALIIALAWNPTFGRLMALRFAPGELAVALGLMLMVSWLPVSGFFRYFQRALITTHVQADTRPEWRRYDIVGHLPQHIFPAGGGAESVAMREALEAEQTALDAGELDAALTEAGVERGDYQTALDAAAYVPPKTWRDEDLTVARANAERGWARDRGRDRGRDPARWAAAGELLKGLPVNPAADGVELPAAWRLAHGRLSSAFLERLPAAQTAYERVYTGFTQGLPVGDETLAFADMPLAAWLPALAFWAPLVLFLSLAVIMLSLVVHRQWSHHEQLTYPIAQVATALIQRSSGSLVSDIVRNRLFWFGLFPIFGIHLLNYLAVWFPGWVPSITLHWGQWGTVFEVFPKVSQAGGASALSFGDIYFAVIGLAFFIASEVSFTMGIVGFAVVLFNIQYFTATGTTTDLVSARSGAYIGYALVLLYTGRTYYWSVLRRCFGSQGGADGHLAEPVWAARIFLLAFAGFTGVLIAAFGLDWFVALAYALTLMIFFLVFTRVVCETGVPFLQAGWQPAAFLANTLGLSALGAAPMILIYYLGVVLSQDPRECLMPFASNAMKVAENTGVKRMRLAVVGFVVIGIAVVAGFLAITWGMYNFGSTKDGWAQQVVGIQLNEAARGVTTLVDTGQYAATSSAEGLAKVPLIAENVGKAKELGWIAFGLVAVVIVAVIRFRWAGFYLHPVLFLVWGTYPANRVWLSFLIGWMAKEMVVRFGGGKVYQSLKPLFIGLIIGELIAVMVTLSVGWIYHLTTGLMPRTYGIFAG